MDMTRRILGAGLVIAMMLQYSGANLQAALPPPTTCPTNFTCSLTASGTRPLLGKSDDGNPSSYLGVLTFDASGHITGFLSIDNNGTVSRNDVAGATCTSGTGDQFGKLDFSTPAGHPLIFSFLTYATPTGTGLLFADATPSDANDTTVLVGNCINAPTTESTRR